MDSLQDYPGSPNHQRLLQAIVAYYADDPRILAVSLFGSLGRGNWDQYSDLDLDVIIREEVKVEAVQELERLCASFAPIGEKAALIIPDGEDVGDVVLESLVELSLRYHPLQTTSPNIIDTLQVLTGSLDPETIKAAGRANRRIEAVSLAQLLDRFVRYVVEVNTARQRRQFWLAVELLHRMRGLLMELFTRTHNGARPYRFFQAEAGPKLQARLGATLPQYDLRSVLEALHQILGIVEQDLERLTNGQVQLTEAHTILLNRVKARLDDMPFNPGDEDLGQSVDPTLSI
jgi:predicted nucleotidyltransferase